MVVVFWLFWYFIFMKIFTALFFDVSISLVASAVFAVVVTLIELIPSVFFNSALIQAQNKRDRGIHGEQNLDATAKLWLAYGASMLITLAAFVLVCRGFSERFYDRVLAGGYRDSLGLDWNGVFLSLVAITIMTLPSMIMIQLGLKSVERGDF